MNDQIATSQKHRGAYYTPDTIVAALVSWVVTSDNDRLLDPSCGDGRFIAAHSSTVGIEQSPTAARQASENAPWALVHEGDFFQWAEATPERFECAAGNPPFIRYQTFKGETRARALALCEQHGARFSGLSSSWAPFLVATAALLRPGGRMAFVVPAEIGHAPYAAPLIEYLVANFSRVQVVAVRDKLFSDLSEDCWFLYAEGCGGRTDHIAFTAQDRFVWATRPPRADERIAVSEWRNVWNRRLRPLLLPRRARAAYRAALEHPDTRRLADFASVGIGYVSGDNGFFHLKPSDAERLRIPSAFLQPSLRNGKAMPEKQITSATVENWKRNDDPVLLLRLTRDQALPAEVRGYLDSSAGREARQGYKCRNRAPWYAVPDVQIPDFVMSYMSGRKVNLVRNAARISCTNSVHSIRVRDRTLASRLLPQWSSPFVRLSCELEGHALGGGMLKLEPREAGRIAFPSVAAIGKGSADELEDAIGVLQRWRHYAN